MYCQTMRGTVYAYCGSRRRPRPECGQARHAVREDALVPWVDALVDAWATRGIKTLANLTGPSRVERAPVAPETAREAAEELGRMMGRLDGLFLRGRVSEQQYDAELERLRTQQAVYLTAAEREPDPRELDGVVPLWRSGEPAKRREMLVSLFDRLNVQDGRIVSYAPRSDTAKRAQRVAMLVESFLTDHDPAREDSLDLVEGAERAGFEPARGLLNP
jgi:hypothetical protein